MTVIDFLFSLVSYTCVCQVNDGKRPPNCSRPPSPNPPSIPKCPRGQKCDEGCNNNLECQLYFGNVRLVCYRRQCVIYGCDTNSDCNNKDDECLVTSSGNVCNPCQNDKCKRDQICRIRKIYHNYILFWIISFFLP